MLADAFVTRGRRGRAPDHSIYVPGPLTDSIAVLGQVVGAVENFLGDHG
ncbi:hypothetical protein O7635_01835 [Asanoa sp. WMMD1127]|nr:hypothetical protein [Asanoa sp. WMMD1127]MDG4820591.1 hypothetical protein [Asanoa sp. WMMD1127]